MDEVEISYDSRGLNVGRSTIDQRIALVFYLSDEEMNSIDEAYDFMDASDDVVALQHAYEIFPDIRILPDSTGEPTTLILDNITLENIGYKKWRAEASYKYDLSKGAGGRGGGSENDTLDYIKINFTVGGGTRRITKSLEVKSSAIRQPDVGPPAPGTAPELWGAIGVSKDGIAGYEVPDNSLRVQITAYFFPRAVTLQYVNTLKQLCGKHNANTFLQAAAGEVLFRSASGGGTVVDIIPITFDFDFAENRVEVADPGFPTVTANGHDVIDYVFRSRYDEDAKLILMTPDYRYVHRVSDPGDFTKLGLPVA